MFADIVNLLRCSILLATFTLYTFIVYPLLYHPLRKIPRAHWSVAFPYVGSLWIKYQRYLKRNNLTTHRAHRMHGEVVRLGYEELSINCVETGVRVVYGNGWEKSDYYARKYACFGVNNMFTTMQSVPHSRKKRTLTHIYSKSYLQTSEQLRYNSTFLLSRRILPLLQTYSETAQAIDVFDMNKAFTMDFSSAYIFGLSCATNVIEDLQLRKELMHNYHLRHGGEWQKTEISPSLHWLMESLRVPLIPRKVTMANSWLENWTKKMCESADAYLFNQLRNNRTHDADPGNDPVVYRHFKTGITEMRLRDTGTTLSSLQNTLNTALFAKSNNELDLMMKRELYSEMFDHLEAGHATSTTSLTYLYWELSRNPSIQDRVHTELVQQLEPRLNWPLPVGNNSLDDFKIPDPKQIDSLPYLNAVVREALRLHAPIPGHEPRLSPRVDGGSTLGSFAGIPGGIIVSAMAHTLHRNENIFPNPEKFDPDRWLLSDEKHLKLMNRWLWSFGSGGRMCIGSNFALQEIKLLMAAIYSNWRTEIIDDDGIEKVDGHATKPKGNKLILKFLPR